MTRIADIYNAITDILETNLTGYMRLSNPYAIDTNAYPILSKGYGVAVGPGTHVERELCKIGCRRAFSIILVNEVIALENDVPNRQLIEQELLDKHDVLRKKFLLNSTLGGIAFLTTVIGDLGISFINAGNILFLALEMTLETEYLEDPAT